MQMPLTRRAVERAARRVAGMLTGNRPSATPTPARTSVAHELVSWCSETHTRRADEAARRAMRYAAE